MPTVNHYLTWLGAMYSEAARLRHREIEPEHMLLGLLAQGGTAAAVLAAQGVTLARARSAVDKMADADLARVGISVSASLRPAPVAVDDLDQYVGSDIPLSQAAADLMSTRGTSFATSGQALQALISSSTASPQSRVVRLLVHCGVDVGRLRTELSETVIAKTPASRRYRVADEYSSHGLDRVISQERFVSGPMAHVAALLSDPDRLTWWALPREQLAEALSDGAVQRVEGRGRIGFMRWRLEAATPARITWSCTAVSGRHDGETVFVKDLHLTEAPGGTRVRLVLAHRTWGRLGPLLYRFSWRWNRLGLENTLIGIARAAAEDS